MLRKALRLLTVTVGFLLLAACNQDGRIGREEHETKVLELDKSELTRVELKMDAGELQVAGGSPELMEADFDYNVPGWKPQVDYHSSGVRSDIAVSNAESAVPHGKNNWDIRFNDAALMDLVVKMGAGEAHMKLGSMNLRSVAFDLGAGEINVDLRGHPKRSYDVRINGGVGQATIHLPKSVGVSATAVGGIGDVNVSGLEKRNDRWINPGHENDPVNIRLDVKGGIGQIDVVAE